VIRRTAVALGAALALAVGVVGPAAGAGIAPVGTTGIDVSYPNCNDVASMSARFGVVGVTGGVPYTRNPCLAAEAARFTTLHLYANAAWNARSPKVSATSPRRCVAPDLVCRAYNYGYGAGIDAAAAASAAGARSAVWWLDVEAANAWSGVVAQNRASIQGEYDALRARGVATVGVYSTTVQWNGITGSWLNGWPSWGATVLTSLPLVQTYCRGHRFTGGQTWMIQYRGGSFDQDVACSVAGMPSAPRSVVASPRSTMAVVSWVAPASTGGAPVTAYGVTASPGGRTCTTTGARACTVTRLVNRTAYTFTVRAVTIAGVGAPSTRSAAIVAGSPTPPRSLAVTFPRSRRAHATWSVPSSTGSGVVRAYVVRWSADAGRTWTSWTSTGTRRSADRTGLVRGRTCRVEVRAVNASGASSVAARVFVQGR
jgi:hypothetical protein